MSDQTGKKATYADIEALPENTVGQIIGGELFVTGRPWAEHALARTALSALVGSAFELGRGGPGGWWILDEPELHLGEDVLVPDLAGWRKDRLERPSGKTIAVAPDWVCEAITPSTANIDQMKKLRVYAREGVGHVWLLDPFARTLEAYERDGDDWRRIGFWSQRDRLKARPFEAIEVELGLLWPDGEPARL